MEKRKNYFKTNQHTGYVNLLFLREFWKPKRKRKRKNYYINNNAKPIISHDDIYMARYNYHTGAPGMVIIDNCNRILHKKNIREF